MLALRGRVAVVTGGGRGIGAATAVALAQTGASVAVMARSEEQVDTVAALLARHGAKTLAVAVDVADHAAVTGAFVKIANTLGPIDVLINNAGVVGPLGPTVRIDPEAWRAAVAINLAGPFSCITAVLPGMLARRWGRIVNVSTGAAAGTGMIHANAYSASKAGLDMLTVNLATELADSGVTVNGVRPGAVDTSMQTQIRTGDPAKIGAALVGRFQAIYASGRLLPAERPAQLIVRLIAQDTTGEIIDISDGRGQALLAHPH
jgi:NAD(P)-dependent dehydrogenase (short-subunit alcohol dehydrogenase family)